MITRQIYLFSAAFLVLATIPDMAFAYESIRCGRHIIATGQRNGPTQYEVLKKCGEPQSKMGYTWIYEQRGGPPRAVVFDFNGKLMRIERLSGSR